MRNSSGKKWIYLLVWMIAAIAIVGLNVEKGESVSGFSTYALPIAMSVLAITTFVFLGFEIIATLIFGDRGTLVALAVLTSIPTLFYFLFR